MAHSKPTIAIRADLDPHWGLRRTTLNHYVLPHRSKLWTVPRVLLLATLLSGSIQWINKKPLPETVRYEHQRIAAEWQKIEDGSIATHKIGQKAVRPHPVVFRDANVMYQRHPDPDLPDEDSTVTLNVDEAVAAAAARAENAKNNSE